MSSLVFGGAGVIDISEIDPSVRPVVEYTESMLAKKRNNVGEIIVTLFEDCNLSCKFCNQDHDSQDGIDRITEKTIDVIKAIMLLQKMRKDSFSVHIMGGEIFQDKFPDSVFESYRELTLGVRDHCALMGIPVEFQFVTNLVHFGTKRVKEFLDELATRNVTAYLGTSYDPSMRFSAASLGVFEKNLTLYSDYLRSVNVVLTAPNIEKFLSGKTPTFDYIYEHYDVFFDYYTPETNWELMDPKDHQLRDMFVWLAENYPRVHPISGWTTSETNPMSCQSTYTIQPDGRAGRCTILLNNWQKEKAPKTAGEMESEFVTKMNCLSCEYFSRCGPGCFLQQHFNGPGRTLPDCWMKAVHARISEVNSVR